MYNLPDLLNKSTTKGVDVHLLNKYSKLKKGITPKIYLLE
jgi:hypothetical protein